MPDDAERGCVLIDGEWYDPEDLEAAAEMYDQLEAGTFYPEGATFIGEEKHGT